MCASGGAASSFLEPLLEPVGRAHRGPIARGSRLASDNHAVPARYPSSTAREIGTSVRQSALPLGADLSRRRRSATRQHFGRRSRADGPNRFSALDDFFARCGFNENLDAASPGDPTSSSNRPHYESIGYCIGVHPSHRQIYAARLVGYHTTEHRLAHAGLRMLHYPAIPTLPQAPERVKRLCRCDRHCDDGRDPHHDDDRHAPGPRRRRHPLMMPFETSLRRARGRRRPAVNGQVAVPAGGHQKSTRPRRVDQFFVGLGRPKFWRPCWRWRPAPATKVPERSVLDSGIGPWRRSGHSVLNARWPL